MEIIVLIIIVSLLAIILFFALSKLIASINADSKDYYFKKIEDLDKEILEKSKELDNLNKKEDKREDNNKIKEEIITNNLDHNLLNIMSNTEYENDNALKEANKVDDIFNIDEEKILKEFISNININEDYVVYQKLYDRFSPNLIYKLKMLNKEMQIKQIVDMISDEEYVVFKSYLDTHKFKIEKFLLDLKLLIDRNLPLVEVLVGSKKKNYDHLSPYIKTKYSEDIYKGMIIKYQEKIYDYSINERDV